MNRITEWNHIQKKKPRKGKSILKLNAFALSGRSGNSRQTSMLLLSLPI